MCFDKARDFRSKIPLFGSAHQEMFFLCLGWGGVWVGSRGFSVLCLNPLFLGWFQAHTHTRVVLAHVAETTSFIVVSGT